VVNVCWRGNAVLLAKHLASVERLSGGRLTAGLGMGGWPADYEASDVPLAGRAALFDTSLAAMKRTWQANRDRPRTRRPTSTSITTTGPTTSTSHVPTR
jgi:alkanesulfonate monooxygenase SsuD/methylene tetrahydromethanopterin reductase-like flavin-dependent oxidoreductase (luciferase family)